MFELRKIIPTFTILCALLFIPMSAWSIGLMLPTSQKERPFDVESHRASVVITNTAAVTTVVQVFKNHTNRPLEAQFVFPIPKGGTVSNFSLWINGKKTKGAILEKDEARKIYESIVRRVEDPGLVEYLDGKLFRTSIFPIPAKGTQKLEIQFGQVLEKQGDMYRYVYPLAAGADYVTAKTEKDFTLTGIINSAIPIKNVYSPSHNVGVSRKKDSKVIFGAESISQKLDRDFELYLSFSKKDIGISLMTHDPDGIGGDSGYFMVGIAPKVESSAHVEIGQTISFVMDTSGSMAGEKIIQAQKTLTYCISKLRPQDNFNVVRFSTDVETLFDAPVPASEKNKRAAIAFAKELKAAGGTAISSALKTALSQKTETFQPHEILFITDGQPTVGNTDIKTILSAVRTDAKKNARIFSFGIGFNVNTLLLDAIASATRGRPDYIKPNENIQKAIAALYTRISAPVMTDIELNFGGAKVHDMYPNPIPDLFRGDQIVLFGRNKKEFKSPITIKGRVGKTLKTFTFGGKKKAGKKVKLDASSAAPLEFIPKLWATRKVGFLLDNIRINGESIELRNEVIRLGKKFGLVTPYTSYLAVDDSEFERRPRDIRNRERRTGKALKGVRGAEKSSARNKAPASDSLDSGGFGGFADDSGEEAVEASKKTRALKESKSVADESSNTRRYVASRTFIWKNGTWYQDEISAKKAIKMKAYSKAFFKLMKKYPLLKSVTARLGPNLIIKLGNKVYKFEKK